MNLLEYKKLDILFLEVCDVFCVENDELICGGKVVVLVFLVVVSFIVFSDEGVVVLMGRFDYC